MNILNSTYNKVYAMIGRVSLLNFSAMFCAVCILAFICIFLYPLRSVPEQTVTAVWLLSGVLCVVTFIFHFIGKWAKRP